MSAPRAEPGGSTPTPSPGPRRTRGRSPGGAGPARTSAAESLAPVSSVASRSCRWGPSSARAPYRARLATDERSGSESAITIPGMGDHDAPESVIRIERKERSRSAGTSDQDASEPAVDDQFKLRGLLDGKVCGRGAPDEEIGESGQFHRRAMAAAVV